MQDTVSIFRGGIARHAQLMGGRNEVAASLSNSSELGLGAFICEREPETEVIGELFKLVVGLLSDSSGFAIDPAEIEQIKEKLAVVQSEIVIINKSLAAIFDVIENIENDLSMAPYTAAVKTINSYEALMRSHFGIWVTHKQAGDTVEPKQVKTALESGIIELMGAGYSYLYDVNLAYAHVVVINYFLETASDERKESARNFVAYLDKALDDNDPASFASKAKRIGKIVDDLILWQGGLPREETSGTDRLRRKLTTEESLDLIKKGVSPAKVIMECEYDVYHVIEGELQTGFSISVAYRNPRDCKLVANPDYIAPGKPMREAGVRLAKIEFLTSQSKVYNKNIAFYKLAPKAIAFAKNMRQYLIDNIINK